MTWALITAAVATAVASVLLFILRPRFSQEKRRTLRAFQVLVIVLLIVTVALAISDFMQ